MTGARAAALLFLLLAVPAYALPVDHIVAAVNDEVITASQLAATVALNQRLGKAQPDGAALERTTLQGLITRRLLVQEARRSRFVDVPGQDVAAALDGLRKRFPSSVEFDAFLRRNDLTPQDLSLMLEEQLLVERFVEKKVGLFVRVTREEAERYFREHQDRFPGKQFPEAQKEVMAVLTEREIDRNLDRLVAELSARAFIRVNPDPGITEQNPSEPQSRADGPG